MSLGFTIPSLDLSRFNIPVLLPGQKTFTFNPGPVSNPSTATADYVYAGARVRWTGHASGQLFYIAQSQLDALRAGAESAGFLNVSVSGNGLMVTLEAITSVDFAHLPDIRNLINGIAWQASISTDTNNVTLIQQGAGKPSTSTTNPSPTNTPNSSGDFINNFAKGLGLSAPYALVAAVAGLIIFIKIAK